MPSQFHVSTHKFLLPEAIDGKVALSYEFMRYSWQSPLEIKVVFDGKDMNDFAQLNNAKVPPIDFYLNGECIGTANLSVADASQLFEYRSRTSCSGSGLQHLSFTLDEAQLRYMKENQLSVICCKNFPWDYWKWVLTPLVFSDEIPPKSINSR